MYEDSMKKSATGEHIELAMKMGSDICERFSPIQQRELLQQLEKSMRSHWEGRISSAKEAEETIVKGYEEAFPSRISANRA